MVSFERGGTVRRMALFLMIFALMLPCFADVDWANFILRESTTDQKLVLGLLRDELYGLQYDAQTRVGDLLRKNPDQEERVTELLNHYISDQHYLTDGTMEYGYELSLLPGIIAEIMPAQQSIQLVVPMLCPICKQEWPPDQKPPEGITLIPKDNEISDFSGIIIDCRDFALTPCLFPKIFNESMLEAFSSDFADAHYVIRRGLAGYYGDETEAESRIGENPLVIRALGVIGKKRTDIKISSADTKRIHSSQNILNLLRECRVAIVFGQ
jgi:hypothetical protein